MDWKCSTKTARCTGNMTFEIIATFGWGRETKVNTRDCRKKCHVGTWSLKNLAEKSTKFKEHDSFGLLQIVGTKTSVWYCY